MGDKIVIIDCGTNKCRFGFSTDAVPLVIPTVVGRSRECGCVEYFVGDEALCKKSSLKLIYPIKKGIVVDWEHMEKIWRYVFTKLNVNPEKCGVIMTGPKHPSGNRAKMIEVMFESLKVSKLLICTQVSLLPRVTGITYGIVVNSGEGATHIVPIVNGALLQEAVVRFDLSGNDITEHLAYLLGLSNGFLKNEDVRYFKENHCVVSQNEVDPVFMDTILKTLNNKCVISDTCTITVRDEMFKCPEAMFVPTLAGREIEGIHVAVYNCIEKCPDIEDVERDKLRKNIILTGGNSAFPGFEDRLKKELKKHHERMTKTKAIYTVKTMQNLHNLPWLGGVNMSKVQCFAEGCVTKEDYEKIGGCIATRFET